MDTSNGTRRKIANRYPDKLSAITSKTFKKNNTTNVKLKRIKVKPAEAKVTINEPVGEEKCPDRETEVRKDIDHSTDDKLPVDLYEHILEYRHKTGMSMFLGKEKATSRNDGDINARTTDSTNSVHDDVRLDVQRACKEDTKQRMVHRAPSNSTPSTPSWTNLSPCDSPFDSEDESNEPYSNSNNADGKPLGYLQSREHGFPQVTDFIQEPIIDIQRQLAGLDKRWQDYKTLAECNMYMLEHDINCDVAIMVGVNQDVLKAHSFILTYRSPEFADLLSSQMNKHDKFLLLRDMTKDVLEQIIRYIYTDEAEFTPELALAIIPATNVTGPRALRGKCLRYLLDDITSDNACTILEYAHVYQETEVYDKCLRFIHVNAKDVFKKDNFFCLCVKCIDDITKSDYLNTDETLVFDVLMSLADKWCTQKKLDLTDVNRRKVIGDLLFNVRFATLNIEYYVDRINKRRILHPNEKKEILQLIQGTPGLKRSQYILYPRKKYNVNKYFVRQPNVSNTKKENPNETCHQGNQSMSLYGSVTSSTRSGSPTEDEGLTQADNLCVVSVGEEFNASPATTNTDDSTNVTFAGKSNGRETPDIYEKTMSLVHGQGN